MLHIKEIGAYKGGRRWTEETTRNATRAALAFTLRHLDGFTTPTQQYRVALIQGNKVIREGVGNNTLRRGQHSGSTGITL